ncbi:hypothetical protein LPJ58_003615 [Coemansia sp. RSA 1591]|nr:hypothetical protein LPJ58_003615 [Coemansia sp. RSA 1591]KAJ1759998.1 hypothetical protein LPJ69_003569 [Coemansia sp. RSA 1752]KAJ1786600.1 hypothetical protein LPJ67_003516 [Coemansia sp. RSA 1938]
MTYSDNIGMAPVPQQAAGNPPSGSTHDSYMPEAYPSNAGRPGQAPVVLFDENREQLKGGGFFGACSYILKYVETTYCTGSA